MELPGRSYSAASSYRYGFNGKEKDTEGSLHYDYGFRIYDPRLGRFKSVDPLLQKFPELTPYQFASNTPIQAVDLDGREGVQYLETQTNNGVTSVKRVVEVDIHVAVSRSKSSVHFYSKNPASDAKLANNIVSNLRKEYKDNKFTDDQGNDVIWRFNVSTFEVDANGSINTRHNELANNPEFRVIGENGNFQYRGAIVQQQHLSNQVMPTEPIDIPIFEDGHLERGFDISVNDQYYSEREQGSHTLGHEVAHFFLRLHPSRAVRDPANTSEGHSAAGGGILNYGTAEFRYPGQIRSSPDEKVTVTFKGLKPLNQTNVTNILQSVPERPATPAVTPATNQPPNQ